MKLFWSHGLLSESLMTHDRMNKIDFISVLFGFFIVYVSLDRIGYKNRYLDIRPEIYYLVELYGL